MISIVEYDPRTHKFFLEGCRDLHIRSVEVNNAMMRYAPPFTDEKKVRMLHWYETKHDEVLAATRSIILAIDDDSNRLAGFVMLSKPISESGPFRGIVECLIVSPQYQRKGLARKLMAKLEELALKAGRTLMFLDTTIGGPAEPVYPRLGYIEIGRVPDYGFLPKTGELAGGVFYYKNLKESEPLRSS